MILARGYRVTRNPHIVIAETNAAPGFVIDARVLEEDTYLVLSAEPRPQEVHRSPRRLLRAAKKTVPIEPGSVLVRSTDDVTELLAVVHDLELEPSSKEEWVALALNSVFAEVDRFRFTTLAIPALGSHHDALAVSVFARLFREILESTGATSLTRILLHLPKDTRPGDLFPLEPWMR
jgi:hypothetical protein